MKLELSKIFGVQVEQVLREIGRFAAARNLESYLIGGVVRDSLLAAPASDLDIMLTGDATQFVGELAKHWNENLPLLPKAAKPITFKRYRTAKLPLTNALQEGTAVIDFSTARSESYPTAGAAPEIVTPATFSADMLRRDFSVNALAISLNDANFGQLVDVVGGLADVQQKQLRVLHAQSFVDDPARLIRAQRFASRLGFGLESDTAKLFEAAVGQELLQTLPPFRRYEEFLKALSEKDPQTFLSHANQSKLLAQLLPVVELDKFHTAIAAAKASAVRDSALRVEEHLFAALLQGYSDELFADVMARFAISAKKAESLDRVRRG